MTRIEIGGFSFSDSEISSASAITNLSLNGVELQYDSFTGEVVSDPNIGEIIATLDYDGFLTTDGFLVGTNRVYPKLKELTYGTPLYYYRDEQLVGKYYLDTVERVGREKFKISAFSAVGLLSRVTHKGGIYSTLGGDTFASVLADIIGGTVGTAVDGIVPITGGVFNCSVQKEAAEVAVDGWLPYQSARDNLHRLLFATNINLTKDENGEVLFAFLVDQAAATIPTSRIYQGGSVTYASAASRVELTEHRYVADLTVEPETLFETSIGVANITVVFPKPIISLGGNLTVLESGVNYAIVSGVGTLTGIPYTDTTTLNALNNPSATEQKVVTVNPVYSTLVSDANGAQVAQRLYSYYTSAETVKAGIILDGEKVGVPYTLTDPFGDEIEGIIVGMTVTASGITKASCSIIAGYKPTGQGAAYNAFEILTAYSGTWTPPEGVTAVRAVLIGGGSGGQSGGNGTSGGDGSADDWGEGGSAGAAGLGGSGGKISVVDIAVSSPIAYHCGNAGSGGNRPNSEGANPVNGAPGSATTFGENSSADGASISTGYLNIFDGKRYGAAGEAGAAGLPGLSVPDGNELSANEPTISFNGQTWSAGVRGASSTTVRISGRDFVSFAGARGVPAIGSNGKDSRSLTETEIRAAYRDGDPLGGYGADGADAMDRTEVPNFGCGGFGGFGGSGGSSAGNAIQTGGGTHSVSYLGHGGAFGRGGKGGAGGAGCILLFYRKEEE